MKSREEFLTQRLAERSAELGRMRDAVEDAIETLEAMDMHIDNPLYDRLRAAMEAQRS